MSADRLAIPADRLARGLYWSRAWSLVSGCTHVSPGCDRCWAATEAHTHGGQANDKIRARYAGLTTAEGRWTGEVREMEASLGLPLRTRKPQVWALWTDLFHERVSTDFIAEAFAVMAVAGAAGAFRNMKERSKTMPPDAGHPNGYRLIYHTGADVHYGPHTFLVLTKRAARARSLLSDSRWREEVAAKAYSLANNRTDAGYLSDCISARNASWAPGRADRLWPLPNVWLGVTVENQEQAHRRIPELLSTPAAHRWISAEPLLGQVDLTNLDCGAKQHGAHGYSALWKTSLRPSIDLVIAGGESGKGARPCHLDWVRGLRDQCAAAGVRFVWKQWGEWAPCIDRDSGEQREDMALVGKKTAGRLLDGREHLDLPWVQEPEEDVPW